MFDEKTFDSKMNLFKLMKLDSLTHVIIALGAGSTRMSPRCSELYSLVRIYTRIGSDPSCRRIISTVVVNA